MAEQIDLNTADRETLAQLPGVGRVLAERIIDFRENVHPFEEVIELTAVSGISERMVRELEDRLTVSPTATVQSTSAPLVIEEPLQDEPEAEPAEASTVEAEDEPAQAEEEAALEPDAELYSETGEAEEVTQEEKVIPSRTDARPLPVPVASDERGQRTLLVALAGALMGVALTLLFLFLLNGTLLFGGRQQLRSLQQEVEVQSREQETLSTDLDSAADAVATVSEVQETMATAQFSTAQDVRDLEADVVPAVATLDAQNAVQATRLSSVAAAAVNFNTFLDSLRDLLVGLQGLPPTATPTPTASPTPSPARQTATPRSTSGTETPAAAEGTGTATPAATRTPSVTRTLRPTATPIVPPTRTPTNSQ